MSMGLNFESWSKNCCLLFLRYLVDYLGDVTTTQDNSVLHPLRVAKSSIRFEWGTSFSWGKGGKVSSAGWQVTLCDPIRYVISRSGEQSSQTAYILLCL